MTWQEYIHYFEQILSHAAPQPPYNEEAYLHYTKMNWSRSNRWLKNNPLTNETIRAIKKISQRQHWVLITEPWCGDAAHIVPVVYQMAVLNPNIDLEIQLRDNGSEIDQYLTNGTKSIPILIVRNADGKDLFRWVPRPTEANIVFDELKEKKTDFETIKLALQNFYNKDKAKSTQQEIVALLNT